MFDKRGVAFCVETTGRNAGFTATSFVNIIIYLEPILMMDQTIVAIRSRHVLLHFGSEHRDSSDKKHRDKDKERLKLKDGSSDKQKDKHKEKKKEERVGRVLLLSHCNSFIWAKSSGSGGVFNSLLWFTQYWVLLLTSFCCVYVMFFFDILPQKSFDGKPKKEKENGFER